MIPSIPKNSNFSLSTGCFYSKSSLVFYMTIPLQSKKERAKPMPTIPTANPQQQMQQLVEPWYQAIQEPEKAR
jgi:hypothetical protein